MATVYNAPEEMEVNEMRGKTLIFLAGSIEMGSAELWQDKVIDGLADEDVVLFNPRRPDWDSSWVQSIDNPNFKQQVDWELDHINWADIVLFYFDPNTKSPITLMELGLAVSNRDYLDGCYRNYKVIVCCPEGFWRKGNVDIICKRSVIPVVTSLEELISTAKETIKAVQQDKEWQ